MEKRSRLRLVLGRIERLSYSRWRLARRWRPSRMVVLQHHGRRMERRCSLRGAPISIQLQEIRTDPSATPSHFSCLRSQRRVRRSRRTDGLFCIIRTSPELGNCTLRPIRPDLASAKSPQAAQAPPDCGPPTGNRFISLLNPQFTGSPFRQPETLLLSEYRRRCWTYELLTLLNKASGPSLSRQTASGSSFSSPLTIPAGRHHRSTSS